MGGEVPIHPPGDRSAVNLCSIRDGARIPGMTQLRGETVNQAPETFCGANVVPGAEVVQRLSPAV